MCSRGTKLPCAEAALGDFVRGRKRDTMAGSLSVFDFLNEHLQTAEELSDAAECLVRDLAADGTVYAEVRFCPTLHAGCTPVEAVRAVKRGLRRGLEEGGATTEGGAGGARADGGLFAAGVIVTALRSLPAEHSLAMAKLAVEEGAVAFDIAGDEQRWPLHLHAAALEHCREHGLPLTLHAGEWPGSVDNIATAVDAGAARIGHGCQLPADSDLMRRVVERNIFVECCMTANVGGRKVSSFAEHPIRAMFDAGVRVTLNSDNLLASGSIETGPASSSGELVRLVHDVGFTWAEARQVLVNGARAAFLTEAERAALVALVEARTDEVLREAGINLSDK